MTKEFTLMDVLPNVKVDPKESAGFGVIPDPMLFNSESGEQTYTAKRAHEEEIEKQRENEWTLMDEGISTQSNLFDVAVSTAIDLGNTDTPGYDAKVEPGLFDNVPAMYHKGLAKAHSQTEAWAQRARVDNYLTNVDKLAASGWVGTAASIAGGLFDADALLIPVSGGSVLGGKVAAGLAKGGVRQGTLGNTLVGAAAGIEAGAITSVAGGTLGTTSDAGDIPASILMGMGMGATMGATFGKGSIDPYVQMQAAQRAHAEYNVAKENNFIPGGTIQVKSGSVGSAQVRRVDTPTTLRESSVPWFDRAADDTNALNARDVLMGKADSETTNTDNFIGRGAQTVQNWVDKSPLQSLYSEVSKMGVIGNKLSFDLLYHPGGIVDDAVPAAGYDAMYTQELSVPIQNYHRLAMDYMRRPKDTFKDKVTNAFVRKQEYRDFDRAVRLELETRYHDGTPDATANAAVTEMADLMDSMHERAIKIQQGMAGETPVHGSEELAPKSGYYNRRWSGDAMSKFDQNAIIAALSDAYTKLLPAGSVVDPAILTSIVRSIVTRSKAIDEGIDTNLIGLLRDGGKEFLRDTLRNNKISDEQIDSIINAFVGSASERAKPGFLKNRIELDMRTPIPGTDKVLLDLLEPDMYKSLHQYTRKVSGTSAMARKGYQLGDKTAIMEAINDEMVANGFKGDSVKVNDILETAFSYFGAGAVGKGVDPLLLSAMRLTRQSLLGSLGLTQMSELGGLISMVGVESAISAMPKEMRALLSGKKTPLVEELHDAFIFMDKDHILYDDELALDVTGKSSIVQSQFMDGAYKTIAFGDKIAGYTSLFYQAMTFSQRVALSAVNHKLYKTLSKDTLDKGTSRRLLDLGLDSNMAEAIQGYINNGTIKMQDGELTMNFAKWDAQDLQDYKLAMHTFVSRAVQKNLPGETPYWATKQLGQFLTQLRMYPIQAAQKQFLRNMRHADSTTASALLWNLGVAGIVYSVSQTVKGKGDELTPEKIAKGAINYAPTSGWLPMVTDPLAEIMGMPELRMNKYGPPGRATDGIIPTPPMIPTMNRMLHLPGAAIGAFNGIDRNEAASLSSLPIVGNMYGFSAMFNYLKDTGHTEKQPKKDVVVDTE